MKKEIRRGDSIIFLKETGSAAIVHHNSQKYFLPNKSGMEIEGTKTALIKGEKFIYNNYKVLDLEKRIINIYIIRELDNTMTVISEDDMNKYFGVI